jgi:hypothetical protein
MIILFMKSKFLTCSCCILFAVLASAQTEKFDIATFTPPTGWERIDSNGTVAFLASTTKNGLTSFCQIFLYTSHASSGVPANDFKWEWENRIATPTKTTVRPTTETTKTPEGWTVTRGFADVTQFNITYTSILITASGFGKEMSILVNIAGNDYSTAVDRFLADLSLDTNGIIANGTEDKINTVAGQTGAVVLNDYDFKAPERWFIQKNNDYIILSQSQNIESGCLLQIFPSQPSSGDLEKDAKSIFSQMYPGWEYRFTGENQEDVARGFTWQGLEYCMIEAAMQKKRPDGYYYDFENGMALVIKTGSQIAVIAGRHERHESVCFCKYQYEYWPQFFNSFTVKNIPGQKSRDEETAKRLVGSWQATGKVIMKYIFAANGHYQFIGAYSTSSYITPNLIEVKTSGFKGDGGYFFKGNDLTTVKDGVSSKVRFRFEKVNHGNAGWNDRLCIIDTIQGKPNEVWYEKEK